VYTQPFLPWLDPMQYVVAPDGGLEGGAAGWALSGAAGVVPGNETFYVSGSTDDTALSLPAGTSATTPPMCVTLAHPDLRLFARSQGGGLFAGVKLEVLFPDPSGQIRSLPFGIVTAGRNWQLSLPFAFLANATTLASQDGTLPVEFRLTALGGSFQIDDVYVDPYRGR
jgi:hypothetical protein